MAKRLVMMRPVPPASLSVVQNFANSANALTPDPKEVATIAAATTGIVDLDFGAVRSFDTMFAGYLSSNIGAVTLQYGLATAFESTAVFGLGAQASELVVPDYHRPFVAAAPFNARYLRFSFTVPAGAPGTVGVLAGGLSVQPFWGHEFGSGRPIEDTGIVERLFSGGFGIYDGVRVGGYQWSFGDLSDAELAKLYALARDRGQTRSILVIEDPDQTDGLNERTHWSLFDRLEAYERQVPGASRYAFKVRDWA